MRHAAVKAVPSLHHEHSSYKWWVLTNIMISTFMVVLDSTIINTALPKVMASFGISVDTAQWFLTSYMLAFAILLPTSGWLADKFGYKKTFTAGLALFTLFSFGCGISWNSNSLIFMRVGQGIGGGLLQPLGMAIIMREFSPKERGLAMGFWAISSAASVSLGPILGGYLADNFNWHLIFNINVPVGVVCIFATWIIQREYKTQQSYAFDFIGFFSLAVFLCFLLIALSSGNAQWNSGGWTSDFMILCYTLSTMSFILFMFTELTIKHPIVNLQLLTKYNFGLTNLVMFIFGIGMFGSVFLTPLYLQNVLGYTALQSGMVLLPVGILQALCGPIAGIVSDKVNPKIPIILGVSLFTISFFLNSHLSILSEHAQIMMPLYLRGIAMGILFSPLSAIAMTDITKAQMAQASGLTNVIRQVGGSFGVAILETLLSQRVVFHTQTSGALLDRTAPQFAQCIRMLQMHAVHDAGSTMSNAANQSSLLLMSNFSKQMFVMGINDDFLFACICMAVCILPILILKTKKQGTPQKW